MAGCFFNAIKDIKGGQSAALFICKKSRRENEKMKIDWKRKLTSRKFWAAVVGFVSPTMIAVGASQSEVTQVTAIIMAGATLIAYIIGEGMTDAALTDKESEEE